MLMSLPANPVPAELYHFIAGTPGAKWLPWYVWGAGTYATKYGYDTTKYIGYLGTVSVPVFGVRMEVRSLRVQASVEGAGLTEGAMLFVSLYENTANLSTPLASIFVDRRTVPTTSLGSLYIDITQSVTGYVASAAKNELAIQIVGEGQGVATVSGLVLDLGL